MSTSAARAAFEDGMALRARHQWKAAAARFATAVDLDRSFAEAHLWLAASLDNRGEEAAAIPHYREALRLGLAPDLRVRALTWLASSLSKTGAHAEAMTTFVEAEAIGGYEPREEFERISAQMRRRSGRPSRTGSTPVPTQPG